VKIEQKLLLTIYRKPLTVNRCACMWSMTSCVQCWPVGPLQSARKWIGAWLAQVRSRALAVAARWAHGHGRRRARLS